jgi:probable addiction module antidote protein
VRLAVRGRKSAPPLFTAMTVLGRRLCLARIRQGEESLPAGQGLGRIAEKREGLVMRKTIHVDDLPEFDPAQYLDNEESIAVYLTGILEANNAALLASALGDIARARGMTEIAKAAGITREALYKALRPNSAPRFDTISRICAALGVRLVAQAGKAAA